MRFSRGENIFSLTLNAKTRNTTKRLSPLTTPAAATQTKWRPGAPERHHGRAQEAVGRAGSPVTWVPPPSRRAAVQAGSSEAVAPGGTVAAILCLPRSPPWRGWCGRCGSGEKSSAVSFLCRSEVPPLWAVRRRSS